MLGVMSFKKIRIFPIIIIFGFYLAQSFAGLFVFPEEAAPWHFLAILGMSILGYLAGAYLLLDPTAVKRFINRENRINFNITNLTILIFGIYLLLMIFVTITAKEIALFSALKGASIADIARQREELFKTRVGWQAALKYLYAIFSSSIIPYWIVLLFSIKHRGRFFILGTFLFILFLTLEKSLTIIALLPLAVYYLNVESKKKTLRVVVVLILLIGLASFLSRGGLSISEIQPSQVSTEAIPDEYNLFSGNLQSLYVANRIVWIPYVTALDWLRYQEQVMHGKFTLGRSISFVSFITGREYIAIEREIFAFEWGQNVTGTGQSNTVFFIDGYMNFGYFGAIVYSIILGMIVRLFSLTDNIPCKCASYVPFFYLGSNSLTAILFSGGLLLLLLVLIYLKTPNIERGLHA